MGKFVYVENEIKFSKTQCGLCIFQDENNEISCQKYAKKPDEVLEGKNKCPNLRTASIIDL